MTKVEYYEARDGSHFDNEKSCIAYEALLNELDSVKKNNVELIDKYNKIKKVKFKVYSPTYTSGAFDSIEIYNPEGAFYITNEEEASTVVEYTKRILKENTDIICDFIPGWYIKYFDNVDYDNCGNVACFASLTELENDINKIKKMISEGSVTNE
jgi:hypothetical protein